MLPGFALAGHRSGAAGVGAAAGRVGAVGRGASGVRRRRGPRRGRAAAAVRLPDRRDHSGEGGLRGPFHVTRRRQPMSLAAEIAWNLLPPLTFGTDRVVISCVLAPAYEVGGDSFDYAVDGDSARFAVFDAMGHGLNAGLLATVAVGAYRNSRRQDLDLPGTVRVIDAAIAAAFGPERFVTAVIAELNLASGGLTWHSAGHPAPLLLRGGRVVKALEAEPGLPLGLGGGVEPAWEQLEPGDRVLFFYDGVVEARP